MSKSTIFTASILLSVSQMVSANGLTDYKECVKWCQVSIEDQAGVKKTYDMDKQKKIIPYMSVLSACVDGCQNFTR